MASVVATTKKSKRSVVAYVKLASDLRAQILDARLAPGHMIPSLRTLSEQYGVARGTAQQAVKDLIDEGLLRSEDRRGTFVVPRRVDQTTVALVFGAPASSVMTSPFPKILFDACSKHALEHGQRFITYYGLPASDREAEDDPDLHELAKALRAKEIDGIIFGGRQERHTQLSWLGEQGVPVVVSDERPDPELRSDRFAFVQTDHREMVRIGVDALVHQGCRDIGLISDYPARDATGLPVYPDADFFREAVEERGLTYNPDWVWDPREFMPVNARWTASSNESEGFQALSALWRTPGANGQRLEGIVVMDDFLTRGCVFAAYKLGIRIGEDIKIATQANKGSDALYQFEQDLALMDIDAVELADTMMETLALMMEGKPIEAVQLFKPRLRLPIDRLSQYDYRGAQTPIAGIAK